MEFCVLKTGQIQLIFQDSAVIKKRPHFGKGNKAKLFQDSKFILLHGFVLIKSTGGVVQLVVITDFKQRLGMT